MLKFFSNKTAETTPQHTEPILDNFEDAAKSAVDKYLQNTPFIRIVRLKPEYCTTVMYQEPNARNPKWVLLWRQGVEGFSRDNAPDLGSKLKQLASKGDGHRAEEIRGMMWKFENLNLENLGWNRKVGLW